MQRQRQVRLRQRADALLSRRRRRAAELHHRRGLAVGDGRQERRPNTKASPSSSPSCPTPTARSSCTRSRATCRSPRRPMRRPRHPATTRSSRTLRRRCLSSPTKSRPRTHAACGSAIWCSCATSGPRRSRRRWLARSRPRQALDDAVVRGNAMLRQFERAQRRAGAAKAGVATLASPPFIAPRRAGSPHPQRAPAVKKVLSSAPTK